jgi:hypothetical protein
VTARLDTRIEWFLFTKCMLLLLMSLPESTCLGCLYLLLSSRLLWLRRRPPRGRDEHVVFFGAMLTRAMLFCAMRIFAEGRWRQTSKYDFSRRGDSRRGERKVFVHPAGNRTGDLSLMRRGWYHKTIASAQQGGCMICALSDVLLQWLIRTWTGTLLFSAYLLLLLATLHRSLT